MKQPFYILLFFLQWLNFSAFSQTSLLVSRMNTHFDFDTGEATSGDSTTLEYNNLHQPILFKTWNIDTSGNWYLKFRSTDYMYDLNGNVTNAIYQTGDDVNGWVNSWRYQYAFTPDNKQLSSTEEKWTGAAWEIQSQVNWQYDGNGDLLLKTSGTSQSLYAYNAEHLLEMETYQEKVGANWQNVSRYTYAYLTGDTKVASKVTAYWTGTAWLDNSRDSYVYDANGNVLEHLYESWSGNSWSKGYRETYTYNPDGFELQQLSQDWDGLDWRNNTQISYTYDAANNLVFWNWQSWAVDHWENSLRQFNGYDADNQWINAHLDFWLGTDWVLESYARNHYATFVATQTPRLTDFEVFPNPAGSVVTLQGEGLKYAMIFDLSGHVVFSQRLDSQTRPSLQIGHLPSGHYLLQVLGNNGAMSVKSLQIKH